MSASQKPWEGGAGVNDYNLANAATMPGLEPTPSYTHSAPGTSIGPSAVPALPPRPQMSSQYGAVAPYVMMNNYGSYGGMGAYGMGSYGGGYGYGAYGGMGMGSPYGGFNRFGGPMDLESRFIQMAEESTRPTFESIGGVVQAFGSVAMMLDSTFVALTSSFRAVLGVAENFGRLRSLFAQFFSTFTVIRTLNWMVRKLLVLIGVRTESEFKAWAAAVAETQNGSATPEQQRRGGGWPVLMFFGVIGSAYYIINRLMRGIANTINEKLTEPSTWVQPLRAIAQHDFTASSPQEISFRAEQILHLAPQHLQGNLWNSGWVMASADRQTAGLIPVTYIKVIRPTVENQAQPDAGEKQQVNTDLSGSNEPKSHNAPDLEKIFHQTM